MLLISTDGGNVGLSSGVAELQLVQFLGDLCSLTGREGRSGPAPPSGQLQTRVIRRPQILCL